MEVRAALRLRWLYRIGLLCFTVGLAAAYLPVWHGDAAIYLPYVRSLAQGRWMEFNPGEPSSGATSPLWVLLLLPGWLALGVDGFKLTGAFWTLVAVLAAYEVALRHSFCAHTAALVALTIAVCCIPWGFLGYETPLAALAGIGGDACASASQTSQNCALRCRRTAPVGASRAVARALCCARGNGTAAQNL